MLRKLGHGQFGEVFAGNPFFSHIGLDIEFICYYYLNKKRVIFIDFKSIFIDSISHDTNKIMSCRN